MKNSPLSRRNLPSPWGNEDTQTLIDIFDRYQIRATFFVVGEWVEKYPESVQALHDAGHEVMNHSNDHAHFNSLSSEEIISNIQACNEKLQALTGETPTLFRPPYGEYDDHVVTSVRSMGMEPIQWDVEPLATSATGSLTGGCRFLPPVRRQSRLAVVIFPGGAAVPGFHLVNLHKATTFPLPAPE